MAAYIVARVKINDAEKIKGYQALTPAAIEKHGGRFIARGGEVVTLEGDEETRRVVLIEFPSLAAARTFWASPEYAECKAARVNAADFQAFIVDGA